MATLRFAAAAVCQMVTVQHYCWHYLPLLLLRHPTAAATAAQGEVTAHLLLLECPASPAAVAAAAAGGPC
jgi:hypothetical protein